jgi:hypothetical protein
MHRPPAALSSRFTTGLALRKLCRTRAPVIHRHSHSGVSPRRMAIARSANAAGNVCQGHREAGGSIRWWQGSRVAGSQARVWVNHSRSSCTVSLAVALGRGVAAERSGTVAVLLHLSGVQRSCGPGALSGELAEGLAFNARQATHGWHGLL